MSSRSLNLKDSYGFQFVLQILLGEFSPALPLVCSTDWLAVGDQIC